MTDRWQIAVSGAGRGDVALAFNPVYAAVAWASAARPSASRVAGKTITVELCIG
jgi:hypothetical protein